jgi:hypothetical protein
MTNNDQQQPPKLITGEHATGEFTIIQSLLDKHTAEWQIHLDACLVFCQRGNWCAEGQRLRKRLAHVSAGQGGDV